MNTRVAIACLALIALLLVGGNLLIDKSDPEPEPAAELVADGGAVTSETSTLLVFNLPAEVDQLRQRKAARLAEIAAEKKERKNRFNDLPGEVTRDMLEAIASCESGGDPRIVSADGLYHGKYQFSPDTWESVGGQGLPSKAPEPEQDFRAALLYERSGPGQWPVCGY